jgi:hypothetical protein
MDRTRHLRHPGVPAARPRRRRRRRVKTPVVTSPDAEAVTAALLLELVTGDHAALLVDDNRDALADDVELVVLARRGGAKTGVVDRPRMDLDVYAPSKTAARDLGELVRDHLLDAGNRVLADLGAVVLEVTEFAGLSWLPDPAGDRPRYVLTVELAIRPTTARERT